LPTRAKLAVYQQEQSYALVIDADTLAFSSMKIPALLRGEGDDPFYERIHLIEEIEKAFESLYREFLERRLGPAWDRIVVPAMREWMYDIDGLALERYRNVRKRKPVAAQPAA
jgi:hypothetical protein